MEDKLKVLYHIFGGIYVPRDIVNSGAIVHISDTPSFIYNSIIKMLEKIKPKTIIHTGDIADDIKLELRPQLIDVYKKESNKFILQLSNHSEKVYIIPGNHDSIENLTIPDNVEVKYEGETIKIDDIKLGLAHKFENLPDNVDLFLFGHDLNSGDFRYLNGIKNINVIKGRKEIIKLCYPIGTDNYRLRKNRLGK
ncbi:hypothetical protein ABG79_00046 [Caloramator mitchellensis]|uniref:Calcineurin-like phosphoesterase domain-containing protein n=1 Tax=Caloramator mitchellensis TaxID=908809 RepID=A0A0R3JWE8_CALMK|nr:metallophosphoesterase [Caloramator mitchellensis]KRQ87881.1 hypothetical protein ABG79_00046 [Caloramator mitchellensis]